MSEAETLKTLRQMIDDRRSWAANNRRVLELLQPEWERFQRRDGQNACHNVYVTRLYADHTSSLRKDERELAALEAALSAYEARHPTQEQG